MDFGLESYTKKVASSVNILIHCALVVDLTATLKDAFLANIKNTNALLRMAYSCQKLEVSVEK